MSEQLTVNIENLLEETERRKKIYREYVYNRCKVHGEHSMVFHGGSNAGCGDMCICSIPVHVCELCGDSDYGDNDEASDIIKKCKDKNGDILNELKGLADGLSN